MARPVLLVGACTWLLAAVAGGVVAVLGTESLERVLPPLSIDTDALRGAVTAFAVLLGGVGLIHVLILLGLRARARWAGSAAILVSAAAGMTLLAMAAAAGASAAATPSMAPVLIVGAVGAAIGALAYAAAVWALVEELRSGSAV